MGRREKKNYSDGQSISMSSGVLHGQVDFLEPQRRRNKCRDQKLKIVQTWIFIQSIFLLLITAYLIAISVLLAPHFPFNRGSGSENVTEKFIQAEVSRLQEDVDKVIKHGEKQKSIQEILLEWRKKHDVRLDEMNATIHSQKHEIAHLKSKIEAFEERLDVMAKKEDKTADRVEFAIGDVSDLRTRVKKGDDDFDSFSARIDEEVRILRDGISAGNEEISEELQHLNATLGHILTKMENDIRKNLTKATDSLNNVESLTIGMLDKIRENKEYSRRTRSKLEDSYTYLNDTIEVLFRLQKITMNNITAQSEKFMGWKKDCDDVIDVMEDHITCLQQRMSEVQNKTLANLTWVKRKLVEGRNITQGEINDLRQKVGVDFGILNGSITSMSHHFLEESKILSDNFNITWGDIEKEIREGDEEVLSEIIQEMQKSMQRQNRSFEDIKFDLNRAIQDTGRQIDAETRNRAESEEKLVLTMHKLHGDLKTTIDSVKSSSMEKFRSLSGQQEVFNDIQANHTEDIGQLKSLMLLQIDADTSDQIDLQNTIASLVSNHTCVEQRIRNLENSTGHLETSMDFIRSDISRLHNEVDVKGQERRLERTSERANTNADKIKNINETVNSLKSEVQQLLFEPENVDSFPFRISSLESGVEILASNLDDCCGSEEEEE